MSVYLYHHPSTRHRYGRRDADPRLGWTVCGIRFAWGQTPTRTGVPRKCGRCWS